jgi:PPE-repeat protein
MIGIKAVKRTKESNTFASGGMGGSKHTEFIVGQTYILEGKPLLCENGFHFFRKEDLCFGINFYRIEETVFIEIDTLDGEVINDTYKYCSNKIKVLRYIPEKEWQIFIKKNHNSGNHNSGDYNSGSYNSGSCNSGDYNSGSYNSGSCNSGGYNSGSYNSGDYNSSYYNSGDYNSGDHNLGNRNSGNSNLGDYNSGSCNLGDYNSGNYNSGNRNSGSCNLGDYNSGNRNSGNYNSGNYNSGGYNSGNSNLGDYNSGNYNSGNYNLGNGYKSYFCTETKYFLFDIEVNIETIILLNDLNMSWFLLENNSYKQAWKACPEELLNKLRKIPEFQTKSAKAKFKAITGIDI